MVAGFFSPPVDPRTWVEVYRATRDGFSTKAYHAACDDRGNLIVFIKTKDTGYIFGAFTEVGFKAWVWQEYTDPRAFLFSVVNGIGRPFKCASKGDPYSVRSHPNYSAVFGWNSDIYICGDADTKAGSYTNIYGESYEAPTEGGPHVLTGGVKDGWLVAEMVAYTVPR